MITVPTTLVLGAGASRPYGLPLASDLRETVLARCYNDPDWRAVFVSLLGRGVDPQAFSNEFRRSQEPSIDAFLAYRPEFLEIGRIAIALALITCEQEQHVLARPRGGWYSILLQAMRAPSAHEFTRNAIRFVTFNYDRSLEVALFNHVRATRGLSDQEAANIVNQIPIVHVYGQLGALPWQRMQTEPRPYEPEVTHDSVRAASSHILLTQDVRGEGEHVARAQQFISEANRVYFLGFSYDALNVERLALGPQRGRSFYGTAYGLLEAERQEIQGRTGVTLFDHDCDVERMLRQHARLDAP